MSVKSFLSVLISVSGGFFFQTVLHVCQQISDFLLVDLKCARLCVHRGTDRILYLSYGGTKRTGTAVRWMMMTASVKEHIFSMVCKKKKSDHRVALCWPHVGWWRAWWRTIYDVTCPLHRTGLNWLVISQLWSHTHSLTQTHDLVALNKSCCRVTRTSLSTTLKTPHSVEFY